MGPLAGLKVIEMSAIGPVPLAGMLLADMGADVLVITKANNPWAMPGDITHRGKRQVELDVKSADDIATITTLINQADIVLEGFRPGVMERLGLGPQVFEQSNPKLIYGRMTGWGQTGPLSHTAGHDINYIAITGALHAMGRGDSNPIPPLNLVGDYGGGTMFLVMGVLAALHESKQSEKGQVIDTAITEGTANLMSMFYSMHSIGMWSPKRESNMLDGAAHFYDTYKTRDDKYISLGPIEPHFYAEMRQHMQLTDADFDAQSNPKKWPELKAKLADVVATKTQDQWCDLLQNTDACFAPVLDYMQAPQHPQMQARDAYIEQDGKLQPAPAPRFSRTPSKAGKLDSPLQDVDAIINEWAS